MTAKKTSFIGLCCILIVASILSFALSIFSDQIFGIITSRQSLLTMCKDSLFIIIVGFFMRALQVFLSAVLTAMYKVNVIFYTSIVTNLLLSIPISYLLGIHYGLGLTGLWYAIVITKLCEVFVYAFSIYRSDWDEISMKACLRMESKKVKRNDTSVKINGEAV